mmetsp:Transcript_58436/g.123962  ORF Transcript_58436/g.123962 Transcript_58436/m.123962 type:complete len:103 (+) Transcript_58436:351-659(+)
MSEVADPPFVGTSFPPQTDPRSSTKPPRKMSMGSRQPTKLPHSVHKQKPTKQSAARTNFHPATLVHSGPGASAGLKQMPQTQNCDQILSVHGNKTFRSPGPN